MNSIWQKRYILKDSCGKTVRVFNSYQQAAVYKYAYGNYGWYINVW